MARTPSLCHRPRASRGYTLVELVSVLVIAGILAAVASPRFFSYDTFKIAGFAEELRAGLRHAQTVAMASGCDTRATLSNAAFTLERWHGGTDCNDHGGATSVIARPGGGSYQSTVPAGVAVSTASVWFDAMGRPHDSLTGAPRASDLELTVGGTETVTVNAESGFVQ